MKKTNNQVLANIAIILILMTFVVVSHATTERDNTNINQVTVQSAEVHKIVHNWTEWKYADGYRTRECTMCGKKEMQKDLIAAQNFEKNSFLESINLVIDSFVDMLKLVFNII